jgi:hypothetical protein
VEREIFLSISMSLYFGKEAKEKRKTKNKNYSPRKKVLVASFLRRSRTPSRGEA